MKILGIDSTSKYTSAAITEGDKLICEAVLDFGNTHSETLLPLIDSLLSAAQIDISEIDMIAVSAGPGSFTGVRIGAAIAKGLAMQSRGEKPCVPVSTLSALSLNLGGVNGIICPVMDARRNQVYNALFRSEGGVITRLCEDRAISLDELYSELSRFNEKIYFCGDGYTLVTEAYKDRLNMEITPMLLRKQNGYSVCLCGYEIFNNYDKDTESFKKQYSAQNLSPTYLRQSQAERERNEKLGNTEN